MNAFHSTNLFLFFERSAFNLFTVANLPLVINPVDHESKISCFSDIPTDAAPQFL